MKSRIVFAILALVASVPSAVASGGPHECLETALVADARSAEGTWTVVIANDGTPADVTLCMFNAAGQLTHRRVVSLPVRTTVTANISLPLDEHSVYLVYDSHPDPMWVNSNVNLASCDKHTATIRFRLTDAAGKVTSLDTDGQECPAVKASPEPTTLPPVRPPAAHAGAARLVPSPHVQPVAAEVAFSLAGLAAVVWACLGPLRASILPLFSRVSRPKALDQPIRAQIADLVHAEPGIHFREIAARLDLALGQAAHHIGVLVRTNLITARRVAGKRCLFPAGTASPGTMDAVALLRRPAAQAVVDAIRQRPGSSVSQIAAAAGLTRGTVSKLVVRLLRSGLVRKSEDGRTVRLFPPDGWRAVDPGQSAPVAA